MGRHRSGPTTAPIDLAALAARAASPAAGAAPEDAATTQRLPRVSPRGQDAPTARVPRSRTAPTAAPGDLFSPAGPAPSPAGAAPSPVGPTGTRSHRAAPERLPLLASTRTAGVLALAGALAGAGLATTATSVATVAAPPPATGELGVSELANASRAVPAATDSDSGSGSSSSTRSTSAPKAGTATASPDATAAAPQDGGRTLWSADFASAGLGHFKKTPWNVVGAKTPTVSGGTLGVSMPGGGKRAEVEPNFKNLKEGDDYYFGFSVKLADDFPTDGDQWQVITQWKNEGTGTPPLEVKVQDGHFLLDGDGGGFSQVIGDAKRGEWTHLVLRVKFSSSDGAVSAWQDGVSTLSDYSPSSGTLYSGKSSYLKVGLYRDSSISSDGELQFGSYAIGTSRGSVSKDVTRGR